LLSELSFRVPVFDQGNDGLSIEKKLDASKTLCGTMRSLSPFYAKTKERVSNIQPTRLPQATLVIPEGSKLLAGGKR